MSNLILKEKIAKLSDIKSNPAKILRGFVRVVAEKRGFPTKGFFFDKNAFEDLLENLEYLTPEFWNEIKISRKSGKVSSKTIEKRFGLI
ncbi:MAG: hypothetical protein HY773_01005 [Candidatus Terrybacteria bacterium]|nr:hypothetical protein [Candidatus Terrybacteria bacterium]